MSWKIQVGDQWFNADHSHVATVKKISDGVILFNWFTREGYSIPERGAIKLAITAATEENFNKWGWSRLTDLTKALL